RLFIRFGDAASAFTQGSVNALLATTPKELAQLLAVKGAQAQTMTTPDFVDLIFNERVAGLTDAVVRQAIGIAIDRSAVVAGALDGKGGVVQTGPFSQGLPWVGSTSAGPVSPGVAEDMLQRDGWVLGAGGTLQKGSVQLAFTLKVPRISALPTVAQEVASQLAPVGIRVSVETVAPQTFLKGSLES